MTMIADQPAVQPIPTGFHAVTPSLVVPGASEAIAFYVEAFNAVEVDRAVGPDGQKIMHATIRVGDSNVMVNDEFPEWGVFGPGKFGGSAVSLHLYVADADATYAQAVAAGATATMPPSDTFWGDRYGQLKDPFGHTWAIATHKRDVTEGELKQALEDMGSMDGCGPNANEQA